MPQVRGRTLSRALGAAAMGLALVGAAASAGSTPAEPLAVPAAFYGRPPAPECGALAARYDPRRLWFGAISGTYVDQFWDRRYPYYAEGCFLSERACRTWLHENMSAMNGGPLNWMRCRAGGSGRAY
jgi:hypothetical protein